MSKITTAINLLKHNRGEFFASILINLNFLFPDKLYLTLLFRFKMGYWINWKNPRTFSEKLQWLKLYNRKPEYIQMVDKYAVKEYVAKIIGEEYIISTLGVWDRPEDIDWDSLPQKFVLKTTHGGGGSGVVICKDKAIFNKADAITKLKESMNRCIYKSLREWPYKDVPRKIIAEQYLSHPNNESLKDYKFFCFNGKVEFFKVDFDRFTDHGANYYSLAGDILEFGEKAYPRRLDIEIDLPKSLNQMILIAEKLSAGLQFLRVDFYDVENKIYFGELTFYPSSGIEQFSPVEWNEKLGNLLKLPFEN